MKLTAKQREELLEAAKPLIRWMSENAYVYCTAIVDQTTVTLTELIARERTEEFLRG